MKVLKSILLFSSALIFTITSSYIVAKAQTSSSLIPTAVEEGQAFLDWNQVTLSQLGGIQSEGQFQIPAIEGERNFSREWSPGTPISDVLTVGDIEGSPALDLSLRQVSGLSGTNINDLVLDGATAFTDQTINDLISEVPGLSDLDVGAAQPIFNLIDNELRGIATEKLTELANEKIGELVGKLPELGNLPLSDLPLSDLQNLNISSIPGLADVPLKELNKITDKALKDIPGLDQVPISTLLNLPFSTPVARVDVAFGPAEGDVSKQVISGSKEEGYSVPCSGHCAYIELTDFNHVGDRWVVGGFDKEKGEQAVKGGSGILGEAFGGLEPTGRPLGEEFKLILMRTDEGAGTVTLGISTRICGKTSGCSPFVFGPWPLGIVKEKDLILLGFDSGESVDIEIPEGIQNQIQAARAKHGLDAVSGGNGANPEEDCVKKLVKAVPSERIGKAQSLFPGLLKEAKELKLTESQTAYGIAYLLETGNSSSSVSSSLYGHRRTLVASQDALNSIPADNGRFEGLQPEAANAWIRMKNAAERAGIEFFVGDTYRTESDQSRLFAQAGGNADAARTSAPPGYSEHHTGYALDIRGKNGLLTKQKDPEAYAWLSANGASYGFEQSFTGGGSIAREDWHWRWVGSEAAKQALGLSASGVSGSGLSPIVPTLKQHITKTQADFFGAGKALKADDPSRIANIASNLQAPLKDCFLGGECGGKMKRPSSGVVTSEMGDRFHPIYGTWRLHAGIDVSAGYGSPVLAAQCGKASYVGWESGYGNVVVVDHGNGLFTRYAHGERQRVKTGDTVRTGQLLMDEASTGGSTGAHLHFEVRQGGDFGTPLQPRNYVDF